MIVQDADKYTAKLQCKKPIIPELCSHRATRLEETTKKQDIGNPVAQRDRPQEKLKQPGMRVSV